MARPNRGAPLMEQFGRRPRFLCRAHLTMANFRPQAEFIWVAGLSPRKGSAGMRIK